MSSTVFRWLTRSAATVAGLGLAACAATESSEPVCPVPDFPEGDLPGALAHVRYLADFLRRKLEVGIFGRVREHYRSDGPEDRPAFYTATERG